ncbi:LysR family transcriptional regulator for metE and metH [Pseudoduganella lurida]|uniref:LysR family transcriptional regulator for metE and metH n=1 Tax=Pseudoduganella lurida TaxID=1036180 RepID=A0A562R1L4_9BURK|nr:LysR substrate-binding domain-containing protein [Pseudoduganella lurida]TWI62958.1 LysR family transcriptional regulator for metE and metH [Pseudoduganella lurida]
MLELRHLRTLAALRSAGSLVRAAELLELTQSALSHQVKLLEDRYGGPLFERKSVPIGFTATGARLLRLADLVLPEIAQAERDVARLVQGDQGRLRIAPGSHAAFDWLMPVMDEFRQRWPEVEIDLVAELRDSPAELLAAGEVDVVIGAACGAGAVPLFRAEIVAVLAHQHPLAAQRRLGGTDFAGATLITYPEPEQQIELVRDVLRPGGIPFVRRTAGMTAAILQLVASRRGIAALPFWAVKRHLDDGYVTARPIGEHGLWSDMAVSLAPGLRHTPYVVDFVKVLREQCATRLPGARLLAERPLGS